MVTISKITREYIDVDFSFEKHPVTKNVSIKKNVTSIKQSIIRLLTLREGDKPFHPEIKSPIYDFLFENTSMVMKIVLESEIRKYLEVYEQRVEITNINIIFSNPNEIQCHIIGQIVNSTEPININVLIDRLR